MLKRFDELVESGKQLADYFVNLDSDWDYVSSEMLARKTAWQTSCLHFMQKIFGVRNVYVLRFRRTLSYADASQIRWELELLKKAREEVEKGFAYSVEHLVSADVFGSILEQAEYLLKSGFKDVAAVLGRVVIENTLKVFAKRENIKLPEKIQFSDLNQLLWKNGVYAKNVWRSIQAQVDLGNYAAHGQFDKYEEKSVAFMLTWIRETLMSL